MFPRTKIWTIALLVLTSMTSHAQKGAGEQQGVASSDQFPELIEINGVVSAIRTGPCEFTNGKSNSGTHLMVSSKDVIYNVHLGPTSQVKNFVAESENRTIQIVVFRTNKLPADHYIAQKILFEGNELVLRDGYLKPFWADRNCRSVWK
ncbi:hypothetical protein [Flagellimonas flava]|uniref:Uncharacterized protein n=1 Tax=Flagellimonas flava TaxID=570519 RepID=A0A1M5IHJ3_9FLAO|nr:hypothetical protein [Allomuricauda flava]SHG27844.1 hypothetical protein SAMN04488116_0717 [Allomuricauda flava]